MCALCNDQNEDSRHMFFDCLSSKNVWTMRNFSNSITAGQCKNIDESPVFKLLLQLNGNDATLMTCVV
jgi:hypothetical protein